MLEGITVIPPAKGVATCLAPAVWVVIMLVGQRPHIRLVFGYVEKGGKKPFGSYCKQKALRKSAKGMGKGSSCR